MHGLFNGFGIRLPPTLERRHGGEAVREAIESDEGLYYALWSMLEARNVLHAACSGWSDGSALPNGMALSASF